jgi:hypothetical protein
MKTDSQLFFIWQIYHTKFERAHSDTLGDTAGGSQDGQTGGFQNLYSTWTWRRKTLTQLSESIKVLNTLNNVSVTWCIYTNKIQTDSILVVVKLILHHRIFRPLLGFICLVSHRYQQTITLNGTEAAAWTWSLNSLWQWGIEYIKLYC